MKIFGKVNKNTPKINNSFHCQLVIRTSVSVCAFNQKYGEYSLDCICRRCICRNFKMSPLQADYIDGIRLILFAWFQLYDVRVNNNVPRMVHGQCYICWLAYRVCAEIKWLEKEKKSGARFQIDFFLRESQNRFRFLGAQTANSVHTHLTNTSNGRLSLTKIVRSFVENVTGHCGEFIDRWMAAEAIPLFHFNWIAVIVMYLLPFK